MTFQVQPDAFLRRAMRKGGVVVSNVVEEVNLLQGQQ